MLAHKDHPRLQGPVTIEDLQLESHAAKTLNLQVQEWPVEVSNQKFHMIWHKRYDADAGHQWLRTQIQRSVMDAYQLALSEKGTVR
ncbi:hypothetical protein QMT40_000406 [Parvibaculaceae bacterium PLY_AMNH_Bact1]|nr:hypothetical protein QMT40_000406 [Parvibaculaceae bacterium PLY_AMNH_Bact1]